MGWMDGRTDRQILAEQVDKHDRYVSKQTITNVHVIVDIWGLLPFFHNMPSHALRSTSSHRCVA